MAGQPDFAVRNNNANSQPQGEGHSADDAGDAPAARARDYTAKVITFPRAVASSVPSEADRELPPPRVRSPWSEDHPSPRCVLLHHRERAAVYGGEAWGVAAAYWALTSPVLLLNQVAALLHVATESTGRGWLVIVLGAVLIILITVR